MFTIPRFSQIQFEGFCRCTNKALAVELDKLIDSYVVLFIFVSMFSLYSCSENSKNAWSASHKVSNLGPIRKPRES
jgi:hypothetical protein